MRSRRSTLARALALAAPLALAAVVIWLAIAPPRLLGDQPAPGRMAGTGQNQPAGRGGGTVTRPLAERTSAKRGPRRVPSVRWRDSVALGAPDAGSLLRGVRFPARGRAFFTWDPIRKRQPNRDWRRWGTDDLVRTTLRVLRQFAAAHPGAPRVAVGDLSRPKGGDFGPQFGSIGHASHQNGLDVDIYYPRRDGRERPPDSVDQVAQALAQDLVDRFLRAGAVRVFVGPSTRLSGPADIVVPLIHHDNHLHARLPG